MGNKVKELWNNKLIRYIGLACSVILTLGVLGKWLFGGFVAYSYSVDDHQKIGQIVALLDSSKADRENLHREDIQIRHELAMFIASTGSYVREQTLKDSLRTFYLNQRLDRWEKKLDHIK